MGYSRSHGVNPKLLPAQPIEEDGKKHQLMELFHWLFFLDKNETSFFYLDKMDKDKMPPVTLSAVQLRLSVSSLCQRKDNTRRPSWFGGGRIRGCWCIDSYPLPVYESCINGWDSHYLHACLLSPTSAGKINPHPHPACFCHTHTNLSPCSLSLAQGPFSLSF